MKNYILHISTLMFMGLSAMAQTSNLGMLYVSEGTKFSTVEAFENLTDGKFFNDGDAYIYSNFNNDGLVDYYEGGLTQFIGESVQSISGSKESYFYNLYFDNTSNAVPFQVSGIINIGGESNFYNGILDNDNYGGTITFTAEANHINTSDFSHVDGPVQRMGDNDFIFPIGDGGYYRFAGVSAVANSSNMFEGKYYLENSDLLYSHELRAGDIELIDDQEYWTIEKVSTQEEDVLVTLSWCEETTPTSIISAAEQGNLTIVRWDESSNMWVNEGGAIDLDLQTVTTAVTGYGVFTFGIIDSSKVLPCNIVVYTAVTPNKDGVNDYFLIDTSNNECASNLHVQIFNRWGVKVFESHNYGVNGDVFDGYSNGRMTINDNNQLPTGTYYYILDYKYGDPSENNRHKQAGFLYLSGN
ncbi:gliding motility-associated C-terminal domain-containing protein [Seonamhaeicola sp. NFXS20]|uniref:gliding motility-associated C-terminal domain-containing protein n=1 Tax=Seonamhaeicola sp. NFXS20 TaxID=2816959 RepID=UPI003B8E7044